MEHQKPVQDIVNAQRKSEEEAKTSAELYILDINSRQPDKNKQKPANQRQILNSLGAFSLNNAFIDFYYSFYD